MGCFGSHNNTVTLSLSLTQKRGNMITISSFLKYCAFWVTPLKHEGQTELYYWWGLIYLVLEFWLLLTKSDNFILHNHWYGIKSTKTAVVLCERKEKKLSLILFELVCRKTKQISTFETILWTLNYSQNLPKVTINQYGKE